MYFFKCDSLKHKLTTKTEALLRVGRDLEEVGRERDRWRAQANTFERNLGRIEKELLEYKEASVPSKREMTTFRRRIRIVMECDRKWKTTCRPSKPRMRL